METDKALKIYLKVNYNFRKKLNIASLICLMYIQYSYHKYVIEFKDKNKFLGRSSGPRLFINGYILYGSCNRRLEIKKVCLKQAQKV